MMSVTSQRGGGRELHGPLERALKREPLICPLKRFRRVQGLGGPILRALARLEGSFRAYLQKHILMSQNLYFSRVALAQCGHPKPIFKMSLKPFVAFARRFWIVRLGFGCGKLGGKLRFRSARWSDFVGSIP